MRVGGQDTRSQKRGRRQMEQNRDGTNLASLRRGHLDSARSRSEVVKSKKHTLNSSGTGDVSRKSTNSGGGKLRSGVVQTPARAPRKVKSTGVVGDPRKNTYGDTEHSPEEDFYARKDFGKISRKKPSACKPGR